MGTAKKPWPHCLLLLYQGSRKSQKTWCRQKDATGTDEGSHQHHAVFHIPISHNPAGCSGTNSLGTSTSSFLRLFLQGLRISFTSTPCFLSATTDHIIRVQFKCASTARGLEWVIMFTNLPTLHTQIWHCLIWHCLIDSLLLVWWLASANCLNSGERFWRCDPFPCKGSPSQF